MVKLGSFLIFASCWTNPTQTEKGGKTTPLSSLYLLLILAHFSWILKWCLWTIGFTSLAVSKHASPGKPLSFFAYCSLRRRSLNSLSLILLLLVSFGNCLFNSASSMTSVAPWQSSRHCQTMLTPAAGLRTCTTWILIACCEESTPSHFAKRSSSSLAERFKSLVALRKEAFHDYSFSALSSNCKRPAFTISLCMGYLATSHFASLSSGKCTDIGLGSG